MSFRAIAVSSASLLWLALAPANAASQQIDPCTLAPTPAIEKIVRRSLATKSYPWLGVCVFVPQPAGPDVMLKVHRFATPAIAEKQYRQSITAFETLLRDRAVPVRGFGDEAARMKGILFVRERLTMIEVDSDDDATRPPLMRLVLSHLNDLPR